VRRHLSWRGMLVLSSFWFAIAYVMQPLGGNIIPLLVARFTHPMTAHLGPIVFPLDVNTYVSLLDTIGAAFAIVWQPAIGAISDNSRFELGRRRPFVAIGVIGDVIFLTLIAVVTSYWALLLVYALFQIASNTAQGPYQGMLPDQVHADQRGEASGYYGLMNMLGTIVGFLVVGALLIPTHHVRLAILTLPVVIAIAGALVIFGVPDRRRTAPRSERLRRSVLLSVAIDTKRYRDFAWLMVSRLFFLMAPVAIGTYAFNFIRYTFHYSEGKASLYSSALQATILVFAAILCMTAGFLAERFGKKRLIAAACVIGAVGSTLLIFAPSLPWILGFGLIVGIPRHVSLRRLGVHDGLDPQSRGWSLHGCLEHRDGQRRADCAAHPGAHHRRVQQQPHERGRLPRDVRNRDRLLLDRPADASAGARDQGRVAPTLPSPKVGWERP
jgi:MFS family permease